MGCGRQISDTVEEVILLFSDSNDAGKCTNRKEHAGQKNLNTDHGHPPHPFSLRFAKAPNYNIEFYWRDREENNLAHNVVRNR